MSGENVMVYNTDKKLPSTVISDKQAHDIYSLICNPASTGELPKGYMNDILNVAHFDSVNKFTLSDDTYYYNIFKYKDSTLVLIYDSEYWACGCIYYNHPVNSEKLEQANTYDDVKKIDSAIESDPLAFSMVSADVLISRNMYTPSFPLLNTENTLHFTDDGLYLIQYESYVFEANSSASSSAKINSIEKIEDKLYNAVYDLLCEQ